MRTAVRLLELAAAHNVETHVTTGADDLQKRARAAAAKGVERLLVAGGDGSVHYAVRGLTGTKCALAVVPVGRGNDFAAIVGSPADVDAAFAQALEGPIRELDVGWVAGHSFSGYCGVGFDSEAAKVVQSSSRFFKGDMAYINAVLRTLVTFRAPNMRVEHDAGEFEGRAMFAVVCNIARFGGGMQIAPQARPDDGLLDLVIAEELGRLELLRVFPKVYRGEHVDHPAVQILRTRAVRIAVDREMTLACDGEPLDSVGGDGVEVSIRPGALRVVSSS